MSETLRKRALSSGGTPTQPSSSKKQRFIDVAKMLLDIAKESSDVFPVLKSCLGGVTALIKHYDEYNDVKDKLSDLIPWLEKLLETLAKVNPNNDREEMERRSQLARSLEDIEARSLALSEKGKIARVLDKTRDSGEVIRLVEKLRQAILIYQVSQQQSIYNQVVHLTAVGRFKASFDALLKLHQTSPVKNKIESVCARLDRLGVQGDAVKNVDELMRRKTLFETLEEIKDKLQRLLSEHSGTTEHVEKEGDVTVVCDLADDLRDAIVEYQFAQQNAIYEQNCKLIDTAELSILNNCHRARGVEFRHSGRQGCLKGTRKAILDEIESWSNDSNMSPVYWLNGLAGTGKSTVAQTIAERIFAEGRLGASFFCSRDFKDRRSLHYIFPTLAFQLAHKYPGFRSILVPLLQSNPDIGHESLFNQMRTLIAEPLSLSSISTVIVIDALDECVDDDPQSTILSVMGRLVEGIPNVKFFITGRPEPRIQSGFRLGLLRSLTDIFVLHDVEPSVVNMDIRLFLKHGLSELAKRRGVEQDVWPTDEHINLLCERAAGLFVYAVATLKFLDHAFTPPNKQLDIIARAPESTTFEGKAKFRSSMTLDSLYLSCFQNAFDGVDTEDDEKVCSVVGTVVLAMDPLPPSAIATLFNLGKQEVIDLLRLIQSLLKLPEDPDSPVLPFHKSFPDFITNPLRCPNKRFHISPRTGHLKIALSCLKLMNISLQQNLLSLPNYALNLEVKDLEMRIKNQISSALQYACKSWHSHLTEARGDVSVIIPTLQSFLQEGFLAWLEVLSVIGAAGDAVIALERLMHWLQEVAKDYQLLNIARDYLQFATAFLEVISVSATHIYHSALELSPLSSIIRKLYYSQHPCSSPRVVVGVPDSWSPSTASASAKHSYYLSSTWSPCGQFIAVVSEEAIEIWDALALKLLSTFQSSEVATRFRQGLAYSPDGYSLAACCNTAIIIWDIQTGGVVKKIDYGVSGDCLELVWSLDGGTIAILLQVSGTWAIHTYGVASGAIQSSSPIQSIRSTHLWAHNKSFKVMIETGDSLKGHTINIFEVGPTLIKIEPFAFQSYLTLGVFSPTTYRISASTGYNDDYKLLVLDCYNSKVLLQEVGCYQDPCFSPDGSTFAAFTRGYLLIWRYTSGHYIQWKRFQQNPMKYQFSPTSLSILGHAGHLLQILHLDYSPTSPVTEPAIATHGQLLDAFSSSGTYIATAYHQENTITITNLHSQNPSPSQFIDTAFGISEIVLTGNVLLVKGSDTLVAWLLTEEGIVDGILDNRRANSNDSLWNIPLKSFTSFWARLLQQGDSDSSNDNVLEFSVEDEIAAIRHNGLALRVYHTKTGETLGLDKEPLGTVYYFDNPGKDHCNLYHHNSYKHHKPLKCDWPISQTTLQEGWIKDPEGKHQLWLYPHWRSSQNDVDWLHDTSTLRLRQGKPSQLVIVKF
ncbi:hypothetical protein BDM02DRAFT_3189409 [Thelephora ganbajun]|uniref:Uncharacterized protein n=1 Tax=Thelephora ganbajun TaxID=370292 RepID=A0ACB6Z8C4_THEGA|nr:hypothetical protein BDM02DRAFT_3189409 [Thelephora ganbajun]